METEVMECNCIVRELRKWNSDIVKRFKNLDMEEYLLFTVYSPLFGMAPMVMKCGRKYKKKEQKELIRKAMLANYDMDEEEAYYLDKTGDSLYICNDYVEYIDAVFTENPKEFFNILFDDLTYGIGIQTAGLKHEERTELQDMMAEEKIKLTNRLFRKRRQYIWQMRS